MRAPSILRCREPWRASPAQIPRGEFGGLPCYDRPMTEALQDEITRLQKRREDLEAAIVAKKKEAAEL